MGPQQAEASVTLGVSLDDEYGEQMRQTAVMANLPPAPRTLADRLDDLAGREKLDGMTVSDAFRPVASWGGQPAKAQTAPPVSQTRALQFRRHKLTATAVSADGGMAIVDGQCITVGGQMDGMRLVSVDRSSATFSGDGIKVKLRLPAE